MTLMEAKWRQITPSLSKRATSIISVKKSRCDSLTLHIPQDLTQNVIDRFDKNVHIQIL